MRDITKLIKSAKWPPENSSLAGKSRVCDLQDRTWSGGSDSEASSTSPSHVMNGIAHVGFHSVTRPKICRGTKEIDLLDVRSNFVTRFVVESWDRGVRYVLATWWLVLSIKRLN